ncbi:MAG: DUF4959 domain-containing protein [Dehalobacterium sp.]
MKNRKWNRKIALIMGVLLILSQISFGPIIPVYAEDDVDETAPEKVSSLAAVPGDRQVTLNWADPADKDLKEIKIYTEETGSVAGTVYAQPGVQTAAITGLTNGNTYTFIVTTIDASDNESEGVTVQATPYRVDLTAGLIGAWDFENASETTVPDESGNSYNGALNGNAAITDTKMGKSLSLNGTADTFMYIPLNVNTAVQDMTLSMWYKLDASVFCEGSAP